MLGMSNQEMLEQALLCFADPHKRDDYFQLYSDDIVLHGYQGVKPGLASVKQFYYAFWKTFPDAQVVSDDLICNGDTLVVRYTTKGTMQESFMGVAATGQRIRLPGISILHFKAGKCFERWTSSDSLVLLHQICAPIFAGPQ